MINVHGIRRNVKNVVRNYTDAQVKVREATSNDPWGPSSTLMGEIADLTYNVVAFSEIMQMIWKRLNDHGKNWRHVYKALVLLEYMIKTGSEKVAQQCKENIFAIQTLKDFQYVEENKDQGMNVREKSKQLVSLLKDDERLRNERARALKAKERFAQSASHEALAGYTEIENSQSGATSPRTELECARPQTAGEEELQLQLALAMSKEEADLEERLRRNDDLRLKMALTESQEDFKRGQDTPSNPMDDLLGLQMNSGASAIPPPPQNHNPTTDPWGMPLNTQAPGPWSSNQSTLSSDDPWKPPVIPSPPIRKDPWGSPPVENDPWAPKHPPTTSASLDALGNLTTSNGETDDFDLLSKRSAVTTPGGNSRTSPNPFDMSNLEDPLSGSGRDVTNENIQQILKQQQARKTPETFLGANSNLVNLDALVSTKNPGTEVPTGLTNPFQPTSTFNPFQAAKPPPPSINQLRAQNQFSSPELAGSPALLAQPNSVQPSMAPISAPYTTTPASNPFL